MKKYWKIGALILMLVIATVTLAGKDVQTFTYAYIILDGQEIAKGAITQWRDYENSDVVQVLVNGKYYLTHYSNVVMIADPEQGALNYGDVSWHGVDE